MSPYFSYISPSSTNGPPTQCTGETQRTFPGGQAYHPPQLLYAFPVQGFLAVGDASLLLDEHVENLEISGHVGYFSWTYCLLLDWDHICQTMASKQNWLAVQVAVLTQRQTHSLGA